jgi:hypothetical protein
MANYCYCDRSRICFGSIKSLERWLKSANKLKSLAEQLKDAREADNEVVFSQLKNNFRRLNTQLQEEL